MTRTLAAVPSPQKQAVLYLRVSTKEQLERDGGGADGYSIAAQAAACERKAESLGAGVAETFVERGESGKSAKGRPELQRMLQVLARDPVDYVVVHKVDRLARNRHDDAVITMQIRGTGAQLVSVTENIDETPSGTLMHGIMSSLAEFYSQNLAAEVVKGTQQKVAAGGTPGLAAIGYLNVQHGDNRTVELDSERSELISWAFQTYATGNWSLRALADELARRGLTQRPTKKLAARPLPLNKLHEVLRNRYYLGYVTWRGVEHPGKHPALVGTETFEIVQQTLRRRRHAGERSYRHEHYLAGSVFCGRCSARLLFGQSRSSTGAYYQYFFCADRHGKRSNCQLPYLPMEQVEQAVMRHWQLSGLPEGLLSTLGDQLQRDLAAQGNELRQERERLQHRIEATRRERYKWADLAMKDSVPDDIAAEKQSQLKQQLVALEGACARLGEVSDDQAKLLTDALALMSRADAAYLRASDKERREYNQAFYLGLDLDSDDDAPVRVRANRPVPLVAALRQAASEVSLTEQADKVLKEQSRRGVGHDGHLRLEGSNFAVLVELRGFEPLTPSMPWRCATSCATAPGRCATAPPGHPTIAARPRPPLRPRRAPGPLHGPARRGRPTGSPGNLSTAARGRRSCVPPGAGRAPRCR